MTFAQPGEVIAVVGPSRVGKSRAAHVAAHRLVDASSFDDGSLPFVIVEAENSSIKGSFSTKAFMRSCLAAVRHPIYGTCLDDDPWRSKLDARINRTPESVLRDAFEYALSIRKVKYLIIDEAHHVGYAGRSIFFGQAILDSWKCLANKTGVVLILVGGYKLLEIMEPASHLVGRLRPIHFSRYRSSVKEDVEAFENVLHTWGQHLRFSDNSSLRRVNSYLFKNSFGCIGHLSKWLRATLAYCETRNLDVFSLEALAETRLLSPYEETILEDISIGERYFEDSSPTIAVSRATTKTTKPFQRKPQRYERGGRA